MEKLVSKERSRKARQRHKQAGRRHLVQVALRDHTAIGFAFSLLVWMAIAFFMPIPLPLTDLTDPELFLPVFGKSILALGAVFVSVLLVRALAPGLLRRNSRIILLCLIALLAAGLGRLIFSLAPSFQLVEETTMRFLLPFVMAPLLASILLGIRAGIALGVFSSLLFSIYTGLDLTVLLSGLLTTALVSCTASRVRTRSRVVRIALMSGILQMLVILGVASIQLESVSSSIVLHQAGASLGGALFAAIASLVILPLLEHVFAITSDISLLEFSDLGHPLLQRLALEAPGTYHHSLVVANIAQAAADAIDENSLEARVSAYFHDIGKLTKPNFFAENIHLQDNPHDNLSPSMSTLIITSHVKEGMSIAMLYKLPEPVRRAIREHHGTTMLQCFHHKAMNQLELEVGVPGNQAVRVDDHNFRYSGPRPSTKVSGIICLADAVEAASRSLEKPTPAHLENLVNDIVRKRLEDGQLDDCELSLLDLSKVRRAFVFTLTTMLHGRIAYPKDEAPDK